MIDVDGSDGGGQLVRSSLTLAALGDRAVRIEGIRGARSDPGLKSQHLAAVEAVATATDAAVEGAEHGSETLVFEPGELGGGSLTVEVGTAGSATLVADALLPLAAGLDRPLAATIRGGTDVKWAPPVDAHRLGKLPLLRRHGWAVALECRRRGFYPEGGGEVVLRLFPSEPDPLVLADRGAVEHVAVHSVETADLADAAVAARQADAAADVLEEAGSQVHTRTVERACDTGSTGSAIVVRAACERGVCCADALGAPGRPAEEVGREAGEALCESLADSTAVDDHLADQLLLPLAIAGGEVRVPTLTGHVRTSLDLLDRFGYEVAVEERPVGALLRVD